ncbi:uncharacterized protein [Aegilops tauschii subsp. strangulata]|uniref:uncharacterized protein n=1 Tax=Aegilops tauschii subsp. strangulata TaxID=200361 RepID=UPI00098A53DC|nr:uncharacterized protein LOC109785739 [Aegilops tauschii subsp. strangulata]
MACAETLPGDILDAIYRQFSSPYDRARFAAVCTSWRAIASWHPNLPALPLLLPSTGNKRRDRAARAYSLEDRRVLRAPLPWVPLGKRIVGCHDGGWVAAAVGSWVTVTNLFTSACVLRRDFVCRCTIARRRTNEKISIRKIVFSKDPASKGCIMAAMTTGCGIVLCGLGSKDDGERATQECSTMDPYPTFLDIAFCNGELYGIASHELLYRFVIGQNKYGALVVSLVEQLTTERPIDAYEYGAFPYAKYIFELHGKVAVALDVWVLSDNLKSQSLKARFFRVFELIDSNTTHPPNSRYMWTELTSLGDHTLFLGPGCCKAVHVAGMGGVVEANCIYYLSPCDDVERLTRLDLGSCFVYCWESDGVHHSERIMSHRYHYHEKGSEYGGKEYNSCTWVLPPPF